MPETIKFDDGTSVDLDDYQVDMIDWCGNAAQVLMFALAAGSFLFAITTEFRLSSVVLWIIGSNLVIWFVYLLCAATAGINGREWMLWLVASATAVASGFFIDNLTTGGQNQWLHVLVVASLVALTFYMLVFEVYIYLGILLIKWLVPRSKQEGVRYIRKPPPPGPRRAAIALLLPPNKGNYSVTLELQASDAAITMAAMRARAHVPSHQYMSR